MQWQFGGNLEPVQMVCEVDWKECPKAIVNYVWSEIVTDVAECLTQGIILKKMKDNCCSKVVCTFLACTMLLRVIRSKAKRLGEVLDDKKILNKVGYKIEDLELKVSILTYKMQYGSWPMPHQIQKPSFKKHLQNLRLTLSNTNDRTDWIKRVLLRYPEYLRYQLFRPTVRSVLSRF
ncbi:uncharacterized protein LOC143207402 [Lasioglossum baleicum]|uniref:uncharacterized protein LOC143207402 n=1 Tax=Lasioglossum baleicum TaxID=434251 RepID=UPI003FCC7A49